MGYRWARPTTAPSPTGDVAWMAVGAARSSSPTSRLRCRIEPIHWSTTKPARRITLIQRAGPPLGALRGWQIGVAVGFGDVHGLGELALGEQEVGHAFPLGGVVEAGLATGDLLDGQGGVEHGFGVRRFLGVVQPRHVALAQIE